MHTYQADRLLEFSHRRKERVGWRAGVPINSHLGFQPLLANPLVSNVAFISMWPRDLGKGLEHIGRRRPGDGSSIYAAMKKSSLMVCKDVREAALLSPMLLLIAPVFVL